MRERPKDPSFGLSSERQEYSSDGPDPWILVDSGDHPVPSTRKAECVGFQDDREAI
jgi:hypothetical protein